MKHTIIIKPIMGAHANIVLPTSYNINNKYRYLTSKDDFTEVDYGQVEEKKFNVQKLGNMIFNNMVREITYTFETKEGDNGEMVPATARDKKIAQTIAIFWGEHPLTVTNGNPHEYTCASPIFNVLDTVKRDADNIGSFDQKLTVAQVIKSMSYEEKVNVAYYYGISPRNLTDGQLLILLADFNTGVCVSPKNIGSFEKIWSDDFKEERLYRVYANKAVEDGVVTNMTKEGKNNYYHGQVYIGSTIEDIIVYFKKDDRIYTDYVKRVMKVNNVSDSDNKFMDKMSKGEQVDTTDELYKMRMEIKQLKDDGYLPMKFNWKVLGIEKAKEYLEIGRAAKAEAESYKM
jgi:hypothetical protein